MKKRVLSSLMAITLTISTVLSIPIFANAAARVFFEDDFQTDYVDGVLLGDAIEDIENPPADGWFKKNGTDTQLFVTAEPGNAGNKVLKIEQLEGVDTSSQKFTRLFKYNGEDNISQNLIIEVDIRCDTYGQYFYVLGGGNLAQVNFSNYSDTDVSLRDYPNPMIFAELNSNTDDRVMLMTGYELNRWYHIKFTIDLEEHKYTVQIDDNDVSERINTSSSASAIEGFAIGCPKAYPGAVYYDNIKMTSIPDEGITLDKNAVTLAAKETTLLNAIFTPSVASDKTITWTSGNTAVATVNSAGLVTAVGAGTTKITATSASGNTAECTITVTPEIMASTISLDIGSKTLQRNESVRLNATLSPDDVSDKTITWTSDNMGIATVSNTGTVKAVGYGNATITATSSNGLTATCAISVVNPATGIILDKTTAAIYKGQTVSLKADVVPDTTTDTVTWSSNNTNVATVSANGVVAGKSAGTAVISVTAGEITETCTVTVKNPTVTLKAASKKMEVGAAYKVETKSVTPSTEKVTFKSSNTKVATVNSTTGVVTAKAAGTAKITATTTNGATAVCTITVNKPSIKITGKSRVKVGKKITLKATPKGVKGTVKWSVNKKKFAKINKGKLTGKAKGTVIVTAKIGKVKATKKITIKK